MTHELIYLNYMTFTIFMNILDILLFKSLQELIMNLYLPVDSFLFDLHFTMSYRSHLITSFMVNNLIFLMISSTNFSYNDCCELDYFKSFKFFQVEIFDNLIFWHVFNLIYKMKIKDFELQIMSYIAVISIR